MNSQVKTVLAGGSLVVLTALAIITGISGMRQLRGDNEAKIMVWFYDQDTKRLYAAPQDRISPDGNDDVRVRAVVIGFQGMANQVSQLKIAYLEKYSPELKSLLERADAAHAAKLPFTEKIPSQSSDYYRNNTYAKRVGEDTWYTIGTDEARQLMAEWREWRGPAGQPPIISAPPSR